MSSNLGAPPQASGYRESQVATSRMPEPMLVPAALGSGPRTGGPGGFYLPGMVDPTTEEHRYTDAGGLPVSGYPQAGFGAFEGVGRGYMNGSQALPPAGPASFVAATAERRGVPQHTVSDRSVGGPPPNAGYLRNDAQPAPPVVKVPDQGGGGCGCIIC